MAANFESYPVSSSSRRKLNAFVYSDKYDQDSGESPLKFMTPSKTDHRDKENQTSWINGVTEPSESLHCQDKDSSETKEIRPVKECPKTPANRIPLAELISNTEDAFNQAPGNECTPLEHVVWQHVPASSSSDTTSQTSATRVKKRRHSSSPTSSPLTGSSKGATEPFDLQNFQALLRTPQNDVATDLWNSYVGKSTLNGNESYPPARFANLLSSSPRTPSAKTNKDSSGLKRSVSCNADWPTSNTKRMRTWRGDTTCRSIFSRTRSNILDSGESKPSKINTLLEKIERSMQKQPDRQVSGPSSSSPLPVRLEQSRSPSPMEGRRTRAPEKPNRMGTCEQNGDEFVDSRDVALQEASSSEYGGDDLDQGFLELANASMDSVKQPVELCEAESLEHRGSSRFSSKEPQRSYHFPNSTRPDSGITASNTNTMDVNDADDTDEFEDGYEEFSENIEEILAKYDEKASFAERKGSDAKYQSASGVHTSAIDFAEGNKVLSTNAVESRETSSGDEFDDDGFDIEAIEQSMSMVQSAEGGPNQNISSRQAIKRYLIIDTAENTYVTQKGCVQPEQVLLVHCENTDLRKVVILRESWFESPCSKGSYIHLIGEFDATGKCIVNDSNNMIILHPDHLISATVVADSMSCQRRAVLQDRVKAFGELGKLQVFGIVFHEVFQEALKINKWDIDSLKCLVEEVLIGHVEDLYLIHTSFSEATEHVMSKIPDLRTWASALLRSRPGPDSFVEDRNNSKLSLSINKLLEVEEHIWSPMYGLKGNIDATVQVACNEDRDQKTLVVPLELKTGKRDTSLNHRAQTALYTLLLSDRYDVDVTFGLLYYPEILRTLRIRGIRHELLQMIQERNRLSGYVRQRQQLPPMAKEPRLCNNCYAKSPCFIYHKLADDGDGETSGLGNDFVYAVDHLALPHRDFFRKWDELLTKEEQNMMKFRRELWTLLSHERESLGRCFGNVVLEPGSAYEDKGGIKINRYRYTFIKKQDAPDFSFGESQITVGEPIVVSDEKGHFALANGYVVQISRKRITVAVDRQLHNARTRMPGFDPKKNQSYRGIMEISADDASSSTASCIEPEKGETVYRLDKDEFSNGMATVRNNVICMMQKDLFQAGKLRRLIVESDAPIFRPTTTACTMSSSVEAGLNVDQKQAIDKVMSAKDYALILGMPGTGKTTTIAHIIRALVLQGKSVLLTSYTHTAVDNILLKFRNDNIRILRVGATAKVHPDVQEFADLAAAPKKSVENVKESYEESQVVATTCLGINHAVFYQRIFDYCIVDEASQITLPVCLGPIRMAHTFILVGDHYQLPPLVQNKEAQEGGLDLSLFKLLSDSQPSSVVSLEHQYRMCEEIMLLSNTLIYSGRLKCGTPEVASRSLQLPNPAGLKRHHPNRHSDLSQLFLQQRQQLCLGTAQSRCWLRDLVTPSAKSRLVNTDTLVNPGLDTAHDLRRIVNHTEAALCTQLVKTLISCGITPGEIGVITFYRSQLSILKRNLRHLLPDLEMHTADKFQGRDKEVVIVSCVRSNPENNVGELLRDWRRVNVAFTRARTKLLVVGSKSTLRDGNELLRKYVRLVENRGWVYDLPLNALGSHLFGHDGLSSSASSSGTQRLNHQESPSPKSTKMNKQQNQKTSPIQKHSPSPRKGQSGRIPLSPLKGSPNQQPFRRPAKRGAKLLSPSGNGKDTTRVLGNRPILRDMVNDFIG